MVSSIFTFLIVLSLLVLIHELGHFLVARYFGVWVEEFGFGLPPRLFGKRVGETIYSINLLPFGGFVRLHGESTEEGITKPRRAFLNKSKTTRALIVIAGVVMNFILAVVAFAVVYSFTGIPRTTGEVKIVEVTSGSPAQIAGIIPGDIVKSVNKQPVSDIDQFVGLVEQTKGKRTAFEIDRDTGVFGVTITPREDPPEDEGPLGVVITDVETYFPPLWQRPFVGIYYGFKEALFWGGNMVMGFAGIFKDLLSGRTPQDIAGPVGIFAITSEAAKFGVIAVINFIGILSVNLAILNIIPFPALDGGRLLFIEIETVIGRKIIPRVEAVIHTIGMIILLILLLAITAHDIKRLIASGGLSGFVESVLK
jgi:regulator of sigma E protease